MRKRIFLVVLLVLGLLAVLTWAVSASTVAGVAAVGGTLRIPNSEPATIDPIVASYTDEHRITGQVFERLVRLDEDFTPQPALASGWEYSTDATVFTFTLREAYFSNGRRVIASDVVSSIMYALSPTVASGHPAAYAVMLYDIQGAEAYNGGDTGTPVGVKALDASTVRFDLVDTVPPDLFLKKLSLWVASILPIEEVQAGGAEWWRDPAHYIGSGPFKMVEWVAGDHILLKRNPLYHGTPPALDGILVRFISDSDTALSEYRAGRLDVMSPSAAQAGTIAGDPLLARDFLSGPGTCTFYSTLDNRREPFSGTNGLKLRQAFNHAVDKTAYISTTMGGIGVPAYGIIPPSIYGYNPDLQGLDYNVVSATQRLAESGYVGDPPIVMYTQAAARPRAEALRTQLQNVLGVSIVITTDASAAHQMGIWGWCADYPDPENWIPAIFHSQGGANLTHYNNPLVDALVDQAGHTVNETERVALYRQAEQIAISEAALLPLWHNYFAMLRKPWVLGPIASTWQWNRSFDEISLGPRVYLPLVLR